MSELPTGTVTFLFTDIEGSTKFGQIFSMDWCTFILDIPTISPDRRSLYPAYHPILHID
jgi:hypothetical protein